MGAKVGNTAHLLTVSELRRQGRSWVLDGECRDLAGGTIEGYRWTVERLALFLEERGAEVCGTTEIREFLAEVARRAGKPSTTRGRFSALRTFFRWVIEQPDAPIAVSPMAKMKAPPARSDQPDPLTAEQYRALLAAAKEGQAARRDTAILRLMVDTGLRASEVCALDIQDVDFEVRPPAVTVRLGKGRKGRRVFLGKRGLAAVWRYLEREKRDPDEPLFVAVSGRLNGERLTRSGLLQLFRRLGAAAGVRSMHPHRLRHTFAVTFLRAGGNVYTLQELLGHTSLNMVRRYVQLAEADLAAQCRRFSPGDALG
jgi:integrase/recombinase XerD